MRQYQLTFEGESWHLTDECSHKRIASFDSKIQALRQVVYKLKLCPEGGTLTIKLSDEIRKEASLQN